MKMKGVVQFPEGIVETLRNSDSSPGYHVIFIQALESDIFSIPYVTPTCFHF